MPAGELVCQEQDLEVNAALRVLVKGYPVAVVRDSDGEIHALGDTCSHADISLAEGDVEDCSIECWGHGSQFDLRTGDPLSPPAFEPVPVFGLAIEDSNVYVDITTVTNGAKAPDEALLEKAAARSAKEQ
ncbi:non-heme iron oxygenase ferredoxin subunit [Arthrobacter castelli]|uniref:non-heme iron oxygenase ferredoxin subunit n=1 Tax=Arthrobacter castelli TaxID=271431 RepID=UPI0003F79663|nr:non-heme iron oxygenase ferredoxin subunit [Arthrobacter castelli]